MQARRPAVGDRLEGDVTMTTTSNWLLEKVARLMPQTAADDKADAGKPGASRGGPRTLAQRLDGVVRKGDEALSPRELRRILGELQSVVDRQVSEVEAGRRASEIARWYAQATGARAPGLPAADERALCARPRGVAGSPCAVRGQPGQRRARAGRDCAAPGAGVAALPAAAAFRRFCAGHAFSGESAGRDPAAAAHARSGWRPSMPNSKACSRAGSTWHFWSCAASAGIRRPR